MKTLKELSLLTVGVMLGCQLNAAAVIDAGTVSAAQSLLLLVVCLPARIRRKVGL